MIEYLALAQQHSLSIAAVSVTTATTGLVAWLLHRRATRQLRDLMQNQEALTDEVLAKLRERDRRVAELELANEIARLDLLNLLQNIGPKDAAFDSKPRPVELPGQPAHASP